MGEQLAFVTEGEINLLVDKAVSENNIFDGILLLNKMFKYSSSLLHGCDEYLKDNNHNSLHLALKIYLDICPWTLSAPQSSQLMIMSADKYLSIFSRQIEAIVYLYQA